MAVSIRKQQYFIMHWQTVRHGNRYSTTIVFFSEFLMKLQGPRLQHQSAEEVIILKLWHRPPEFPSTSFPLKFPHVYYFICFCGVKYYENRKRLPNKDIYLALTHLFFPMSSCWSPQWCLWPFLFCASKSFSFCCTGTIFNIRSSNLYCFFEFQGMHDYFMACIQINLPDLVNFWIQPGNYDMIVSDSRCSKIDQKKKKRRDCTNYGTGFL